MSEPSAGPLVLNRCAVCANKLPYCSCPKRSPTSHLPVIAEGRKCGECDHHALIDSGYSNYTVEGSDLYCMVNAHPFAPFDAWYGKDDRMAWAALCPQFERGEGLHLDVDREDDDEIADRHLVWLALWDGPEPLPPAPSIPPPPPTPTPENPA